MMLKENRLTLICSHFYPTSEEVVINQIKYQILDTGGQEVARKLWKNYLEQVNAIVFVVDACDRSRFDTAKYELEKVLAMEELKNIPFVIFGNKIDSPYAVNEEEFKACLGLDKFNDIGQGDSFEKKRPVKVFMCSVFLRFGFLEGFNLLSQFFFRRIL
ncbi:hypothetical protein SteCoe_28565 [Stentor coeruleus]|uniref:Uncharacterized protein n=1 Tax=Stentor coeruleus TaxID=5963 RepID=A0A1R2B877_9CILI|nr:hypothetical protein SteCoe_28565 [Stentor coeruleus]